MYLFCVSERPSIVVAPPIPKNESQRLTTLRALHILDTPSEERFDRITRLATSLFNVPIAMVSLIEDDRQWLKSCQGLPLSVREVSRDISFCAHAILEAEIFVIPDTLHDPRFANNPFVTGDPWIRFYAGRPLFALDGSALGTVCILDHRPRQLSDADRQALCDLGTWVENEINTAQISQALYDQREMDRLKTDFVSHVSHELRTPLTVIKGYIDLFMEGAVGPVSSLQHKQLSLVQQSTDHLIALVNNVLDISQIESGQIELRPTVVDLTKLMREVIALLRPQIVAKQQTLTLAVAQGLPSVFADSNRLVQIFMNLLSNAYQYAPVGGHIRITMRPDAQHVRIEVQDNGIGISDEEQQHIFTKFFRTQNHLMGAISGTGLGLAITRALVEMHKGTITVASTPGHGSTFTVVLPQAQQS